mmetsp:Transcript_26163/g.39211  ORF Transcript_26163/g.39211 Transcript_26163/m.39211 type:complete len:1332 (-) Transcript_26163:224-4219(-)
MPDETSSVIPFMDTFYSLSSNDHQERNVAGSSLIHHLFLSTGADFKINDKLDKEKYQGRFDAIIKDGCYALTRLLNGLCSGRASARQGYASCLSSFLKLSFQMGPPDDLYPGGSCWMDHFMQHMNKSKDQNTTPLEFVRKQLLNLTSPETKGHTKLEKKGSEDRDYIFGKLFGILAVARSGILGTGSPDDSFENVKGYTSDLLSLYHHKKWMQEPAVHALKELFTLVSSDCGLETVSKLLEDNQYSSFFAQQCSWTASKVALYIHLQAIFLYRENAEDLKGTLPDILKTPLLTVSSLQTGSSNCDMNSILKDTAVIVHPRCHVVWESIWFYLCGKSDTIKRNEQMVLKSKIALGQDAPADIVKALVNDLIVKGLLGESDSNHNITHERRSLAMTLISRLCEVQLPPDFLEQVILHPTIVEKLFLQTLKTRTKPGEKSHTLKPLASKILQRIVRSLDFEDNNIERRLAIARSLIHAHPSFDEVTQTQTISSLLCLDSVHQSNESSTSSASFYHKLWEQYLDFIKEELFTKCINNDDELEIMKYVNLIFNFTKHVSHVGSHEHRQYFFRRVTLILIIGAFFNFDFVSESSKSEKDTESRSIWSIVKSIQKDMKRSNSPIPHRIRVIMSSKFFSLLSDYIATDKRITLKKAKVELIIAEVSYIQSLIETIESFGATLINKGNIINEKDSGLHDLFPFDASLKICSNLKEIILKEDQNQDEMKTRILSAILGLICPLSLQLLHPGQSDNMNESEGDEIDEVFDEVIEMLTDLLDVATGLFNQGHINKSDEDKEVDPLCSFAATCVNIFNSSIGGSTLNNSIHLNGGARLVRDSVQGAWGSMLGGISDDSSSLDLTLNEEVLSILLESICYEEVFSDPTIYDKDSEMEDADSSEYDNKSQEKSFSAFTDANTTGIDFEGMEIDDSESKDQEDIELDPLSLENLLLEDTDILASDEENTLEHHSGADGALAQLIKLKQEARKAGQNKREKNELSNRVRCFSLLEAVFPNKKRSKTIPNNIALMTILPLLRTRTILLKSVLASENSLSQKSTNCVAEKRVLIDRITSFLENKIGKTHVVEKMNFDACQTLSKQIIIELNSVSSADHCKLCSSLLVLVVKSVGENGPETLRSLSKSIYDEAVREWSQKRNSNIQSLVFDDFISACPSDAKFALLSELIKASTEARSHYLKSEAFRMISELFHVNENDNLELKSMLQENSTGLCASIEAALGDDGLIKAKRIRDVLKATEKLIDFSSIHGDEKLRNATGKLVTPLQALASTSGSVAVKSLCKKMEKSIEEGLEQNTSSDVAPRNERKVGSGTSSKKSKKGKKKNKKKGKK